MSISKQVSIGLLATFILGMNPAVKAAVIKPILTGAESTHIIKAKSMFNFSFNVGPSYPYPVYSAPYPVPVYQPYYGPPAYPVYREYHSYSVPVYEETVCSYDPWGNPYNCYIQHY